MTAPPTAPGPVLVDVQATQSTAHRDRGIARYTAELSAALWARHPDLVHSFVLDPDLAPPGSVEPLVASGRLVFGDRVDVTGARLLHVVSPIELDAGVERIWPARAATRGMRLAVTLYDLIPEIFAERYLADPGLRRRYRARLEVVRAADVVLAISEATAIDASKYLKIPDEKIVVVGAAAGGAYSPPESRSEALAAARAAVPSLEDRFVLYTAGMDDRKNFHALFRAWSRLPASVRDTWQLVMVCSIAEASTRNHVMHLAREAGIEERLLLTGFVPDPVLRLLYQSTDLFVFPSLYEGFGLPVAEALACGARTIGSNTSAVAELLVPEAGFDPTSDGAIASAIERGLTDDPTRAVLDRQAQRALPSWSDVADRVAGEYRRLLARRRPPARRRPLVAVVTPLPPAATGVADYSYRLLESLRAHCDLHAFADGCRRVAPELGPPRAPAGVEVLPVRRLLEHERARGGYDCVVFCLGNSQFHAGALALLRSRAGVVLAHEVRFTDLYALSADEPGAVPSGFEQQLADLYPSVPLDAVAGGRLPVEEAERHGVLMAAELASLAERFLVTSEFAADRLLLDIRSEHVDRVRVVPYAMPAPADAPTPAGARPPVVATFGVVNEVKQPSLLLTAFAEVLERRPDASLAFIGPCADADRDHLVQLAATLGIAERVTLTGVVTAAEWAAWLDRAAVAVQLRRTTNGEWSGAVADCLGSGAATVVTGIGPARELPEGVAVPVDASITPAELAGVVGDLLADPERRARLAAGARQYASSRSFAAAAREFFERVIEPAARAGLSPARSRPPALVRTVLL